ncbi:MAG: aspartyl protease family protein [Bacteroidales bacterium]|nr:aspartyl protease family protein [Bacteroidales bacterium]
MKKTKIIIICIIGLIINSTTIYCQTKDKLDFIDKSGKGFTKIPMIIKKNSPLIEVKLDTNKMFLLVDIGGFASLNLDTSVVSKCAYNILVDSTTSKNYKGETIEINYFTIPELIVGDFHFSNFKAKCGKQKNKTGYIGLSFFSNFKVLFDYKNSNLYLIHDSIPQEFDINTWKKVSFNYNKFGISSTVNIDGKEYSFFWDTGASFSLLKPEFADKNKILKRGNFDFYSPQTISLNSNTYKFDLLIMDFKFPPFDGVIGHNFFSNKIIFIDFEKQLIYIKE